jgi:outer membrane protein
MKKVLLSAVALLAFGFANAQEEKSTNGGFSKGDVFVSGAFSFGSFEDKDADSKSSSFTISPKEFMIFCWSKNYLQKRS